MTMYEREIRELLFRLGANSHYCGFEYIMRCIEIMMQSEAAREYVKVAYVSAAATCNTDDTCVERDIRTVIESIWRGGNQDLLEEIIGYLVTSRPKAKEFLNRLTDYVLLINNVEMGCTVVKDERRDVK